MSIVLDVPRDMIRRYAVAAPRYTSYPTAVDWTGGVDVETYRERLASAASSDAPCAVYFHVPFCEERCLFCGCNVFITHDHGRGAPYLDHLEREIATVGESGIGRRPVTQLHWGGGTPTWLSADEIRRLHAAWSRVFSLAPDAEVAIEVDPRVTSDEQIAVLGELGFNRVSLGIQDFNPVVQKAIKRVQSVEETRRVVERSREAGMESVNVDLIYGLPYQTLDGFLATIEEVLKLRPERIALFHYAHVPWLKKHQTAMDLDSAPAADLKMTIFSRAIAEFTGNGYEYLGLDHFALPGDELARARHDRTLQRNFMGYSTRAGHDLIGFGTSAIGEVGGVYVQNDPDYKAWGARVDDVGLGVHRGHLLSADDRLRRRIIMVLMCHGIIVKEEISAGFGIDFDATFASELAMLEPLAADGLVRLEPGAIVLTRLGQVFMRNVACVFDRFYQERHRAGGETRQTFSRTV